MKSIITSQKKFFSTNATKPVAFRLEQLRKLRAVLRSNEKMLTEAVYKDFQKGSYNTFITEFARVYVALNDAIKNVGRWARVKRASTSMVNFPGSSYVIPEPLGSCLVIGSWNYPINLTLVPAIAAMVAGNTVVMKPSELSAHTSTALAEIISNNFDPSYFAVLEGGVDVTTELLSEPFDKIFFTGSVPVGKIVYEAAAKNLVPVTLELGGKSPLIIAPDANLKTTVKRLVWGKFVNAGQTCVAPVLVNVTERDKIMADEIFGPILPVMTYENIDEAIKFIKARPKPLSLYLFSESSSLRKKIWSEVSFGGGMVNDVLMHFVNESLPFGGVGNSGMGSYHGEAGFKTFSHFKSVMQRPTLFEFPLKYFPFGKLKLALIKKSFGV